MCWSANALALYYQTGLPPDTYCLKPEISCDNSVSAELQLRKMFIDYAELSRGKREGREEKEVMQFMGFNTTRFNKLPAINVSEAFSKRLNSASTRSNQSERVPHDCAIPFLCRLVDNPVHSHFLPELSQGLESQRHL